MADPFAGSSGIAVVNIASSPWQPLQDKLDKDPYEGFYKITLLGLGNNIFSKGHLFYFNFYIHLI